MIAAHRSFASQSSKTQSVRCTQRSLWMIPRHFVLAKGAALQNVTIAQANRGQIDLDQANLFARRRTCTAIATTVYWYRLSGRAPSPPSGVSYLAILAPRHDRWTPRHPVDGSRGCPTGDKWFSASHLYSGFAQSIVRVPFSKWRLLFAA